MAKYSLKKGTKAGYNAIAQKDANTVYFCTDTGEIFVGVNPMFDNEVLKSVSLKSTGKALVVTKRNGTTAEVDLESIINGGVITLTGYEKPSQTAAVTEEDTVNEAIGKLEKALDNVGGDAITEVEAGNGINVSTKANHKQTVSVNIKSGDKLLSATGDGIQTNIKLQYDSDTRKIQLLGNSDTLISEFSAADFIKDGMLFDQILTVATGASMAVSFPKGDSHTFTGLTQGHPYLFLEFNDGLGTEQSKTFASCDMNSLIDVYSAGNGLQIGTGSADHTFSIKLDTTHANGLAVTSSGLKLVLASSTDNGALSSVDYQKIQNSDAATEWGSF
ncbi:MAG: hypothetical protein MJY71_02395 [Bacteroidaceae bacterium]|nr:hypothetical protein [Bacteroidaceae bacterium]